MSELLKLQNHLQEHLLDHHTDIFQDIINTEKVNSEIRLAIYSNAYRSRLLEALATNYPLMQSYLGHEQFEELGYKYIENFPSHYRSIRWFGNQLEEFLQKNSPYVDFPYLSELAKIEWTMTLVFDAADGQIATIEMLGDIPPEDWIDMRLLAHPSVHQIQLSWNTMHIWENLSESGEEAPSEPVKNTAPVNWIFWRKDFINHYYTVAEDESCALAAMLNGNSFGQICEILCDFVDEDEVAIRAASLLKDWISLGLISEINVNAISRNQS